VVKNNSNWQDFFVWMSGRDATYFYKKENYHYEKCFYAVERPRPGISHYTTTIDW